MFLCLFLGELGPTEEFLQIFYLKGFHFTETWKECATCQYEYFDRYLACPNCSDHQYESICRVIFEAHIVRDSISELADKFVIFTSDCQVLFVTNNNEVLSVFKCFFLVPGGFPSLGYCEAIR